MEPDIQETTLKHQLDQVRLQIDALDEQLLGLLSERAELALQVGEIKNQLGWPVYDAGREEQILNRLCEKAPSPWTPQAIRSIYIQIMTQTRQSEQTHLDGST